MIHFTDKHSDTYIIFLLQVKKSSRFCCVHTFQLILLEEYGNIFCWNEFAKSYSFASKISLTGYEFRVEFGLCRKKIIYPFRSIGVMINRIKSITLNVVNYISFSIQQMAIIANVNKRIIQKYRTVSIIVEIFSENRLPVHCFVLTLFYYVYCCW